MKIERAIEQAREKARVLRYIECPTVYGGTSEAGFGDGAIFLAGGITGVDDWQEGAAAALISSGQSVLNPRRKDFPIDDPKAAAGQIAWEFDHLRKATKILFWFAADEVQPIALYELGAWSMTDKPIFVGADPKYPRRDDVVIQTGLARPGLTIYDTLGALLGAALGLP